MTGAARAPVVDSSEPVGWLDREPGLRSVPLYSGVHPVTGDQLLTTNQWQANDFGYIDIELLGYLDAETPLTGTRETMRPELPWASRLGQMVRMDAPPAPSPRGAIDSPPTEVVAPFVVSGWALAGGLSVSAIEIAIDGRFVGRARVGLERLGIAAEDEDADAPVCGFEYVVLAAELPPGKRDVTVTATARDLEGRTFTAGTAVFRIAERRRPPDRSRGEELRRRARGLYRPRPAASGLNVLVVTHRLDRGGAQLWLHELIEHLAARPHISMTVAAVVDGPLRAPLESLGVHVHITGEHPLGSIDEYEGRLAERAAWAAPHGFDVVLVNALRSFPAVEAADLLGTPCVFALHESFTLDEWWVTAYGADAVHPYVRERGESALALPAAVVFEAEATRRLYEPYGDSARLITFPYGIDLSVIEAFKRDCGHAAARERLGIAASAKLVLCLGSVEPRKGQSMLAQAFRAVAAEHREAVLALVGETRLPHLARHNAALRDYIGRAQLGDRVRVLPMSETPHDWHRAADLFVCASDVESLPRVVLEAMAFEVPVLATRIFGLPEVIEDCRNGWLCEPRDVRPLAGALARALAADPEKRAAIGRAARRTVVGHHDAAAYADRFAALLEGIAADPRADPGALLGVQDVASSADAG